jgi:hypothetical protein
MDQAVTPLPRAKGTINEETYRRLKGLRATLAFIASGCEDIGGPLLWDALRQLDDDFGDCVQKLEDETGFDQ